MCRTTPHFRLNSKCPPNGDVVYLVGTGRHYPTARRVFIAALWLLKIRCEHQQKMTTSSATTSVWLVISCAQNLCGDIVAYVVLWFRFSARKLGEYFCVVSRLLARNASRDRVMCPWPNETHKSLTAPAPHRAS